MTDAVWRREEIASPCVKICVIHPGARICVGCGRTLDEIAGWSAMAPDDRATVMAALPGRMSALTAPENRPSRRRRDRA
jgi:predicted Fe-S protein YdhL (DUF1289 family)